MWPEIEWLNNVETVQTWAIRQITVDKTPAMDVPHKADRVLFEEATGFLTGTEESGEERL